MSPARTLPLAIPVGVAGAVAVVIFQNTLADALGGALASVALIAVTWSAIRLAREAEAPV
jgi:hypothetical protein